MSEIQAPASMTPSSAEIAKSIAPPAETQQPDLAPAPKVEEKKEEQDYSSRFAALSRREKQLIEKERKLKEIESKYKDKDSNYQSWEEKKAKFKANPDSIFDEVGMSFDELINYKLGLNAEEAKPENPNDMYKKLKAELENEVESKLRAREEAEQKARAEAQERENAQTIENFKSELVDTLKSQSDKYELINYQGNYDLVFDVIQQYFDEHEEVLSIDKAADHVESYLESLVEGATKLKKFQSKLAPKAEPTQVPESAAKTAPAQESLPKTLSNAMNSQNSSFNREPISIEESKRRAAQLLRWSSN